MSKAQVVDITEKLCLDKPSIKIGDKTYEVDNTIEAVLQYQTSRETNPEGDENNIESLKSSLRIALGAKAVKELNIDKMSFQAYQVLMIGVAAAMQGVSYEEAEERFQ